VAAAGGAAVAAGAAPVTAAMAATAAAIGCPQAGAAGGNVDLLGDCDGPQQAG
jgi:hypothetical protein